LKGIDDLAPVALAMVSLAILVGIGAVVLVEMEGSSYNNVDVVAESSQPGGPLPANYSLSEATGSSFVTVTSTDVVLEDASASTNVTLEKGTDYVLYEDEGTVELQSTPGGVSYDDTSDTVYTDYSYDEEGQATSILGDGQNALSTFGDFFQVLVVVAIAAVIFLLLGALRKAGGRSMA
jgi:hypothetical protein